MFLIHSCSSFFGSYDLGANFTLLDGDRVEDRIIVYCSPNNGDKWCSGGMYIIPTYEKHYKNGKYAEYVEIAKSNERWIIAQSLDIINKKKNYWIIDKSFKLEDKFKEWPLSNADGLSFDSIIQSHILGPLSYKTFKEKKDTLDIKIIL